MILPNCNKFTKNFCRNHVIGLPLENHLISEHLKSLLKFQLSVPNCFFFYNLIFILYWDRVDLQCCVSSRNTAEWFSCIYEVIGMFILFRFFPHVGYYRILSRAPCVYSWSLLIICFIPIMYLFIWNCSEDLVVPTDMHFNSLGHSVRLIWRPHFKNF